MFDIEDLQLPEQIGVVIQKKAIRDQDKTFTPEGEVADYVAVSLHSLRI